MSKAIEVKGLKKSYRDVPAVKGIDFDVDEGSLFAFLGVNGAGKSTTINILCTLLDADGGDVNICGADLKTDAAAMEATLASPLTMASAGTPKSVSRFPSAS